MSRRFDNSESNHHYGLCKVAAAAKGLDYLFVTSSESNAGYTKGIIEAVGIDNVFFLDDPKDWGRFLTRVAASSSMSMARGGDEGPVGGTKLAETGVPHQPS